MKRTAFIARSAALRLHGISIFNSTTMAGATSIATHQCDTLSQRVLFDALSRWHVHRPDLL